MGRNLVCFTLFFLLIGCDQNRVYDHYESLPNTWHKDSIISFKVEDLDTLQAYNIFINLRNTNDFAFSNLYLITQLYFPRGKVVQDTLEYEMAYPNGEWMGVGIGEAKASKLWYKKNIRFEEEGPYTIDIRQVMRRNGEKEALESLDGITEVGLRIEKQPANSN